MHIILEWTLTIKLSQKYARTANNVTTRKRNKPCDVPHPSDDTDCRDSHKHNKHTTRDGDTDDYDRRCFSIVTRTCFSSHICGLQLGELMGENN